MARVVPSLLRAGPGREGAVSLHELWDMVALGVQEGVWWRRMSWERQVLQLCQVKGQGGDCGQEMLHISITCRGNQGMVAAEISDLRAQSDAEDGNQLEARCRCPGAAPSSPHQGII